jgi:hypothetical protein
MPDHSITITNRDQQILEMIYFYDTCSIDHLTTKFFPQRLDSLSLYGRKVACYRRIAELREAGYVETYRLGSTTGVGSGKMLISLGSKGRKTLSGYLASKSELRRQKEVSIPAIRDHHLAICDFRLAATGQEGLLLELPPQITRWELVPLQASGKEPVRRGSHGTPTLLIIPRRLARISH